MSAPRRGMNFHNRPHFFPPSSSLEANPETFRPNLNRPRDEVPDIQRFQLDNNAINSGTGHINFFQTQPTPQPTQPLAFNRHPNSFNIRPKSLQNQTFPFHANESKNPVESTDGQEPYSNQPDFRRHHQQFQTSEVSFRSEYIRDSDVVSQIQCKNNFGAAVGLNINYDTGFAAGHDINAVPSAISNKKPFSASNQTFAYSPRQQLHGVNQHGDQMIFNNSNINPNNPQIQRFDNPPQIHVQRFNNPSQNATNQGFATPFVQENQGFATPFVQEDIKRTSFSTDQVPTGMPPPSLHPENFQNNNQQLQANYLHPPPLPPQSLGMHQNQFPADTNQMYKEGNKTVMNKPEDSEQSNQDWVNSWLRSKGKRIMTKRFTRPKPALRICDVQSKMRKMMYLMAEFQQHIKILESSVTMSGEEWTTNSQKISSIKKELDSLRKEVQDEEMLKELQRKIELRRRKRERIKRKRKEQYEEKKRELADREELTQKIDEWREKITQEQLRQKEEKELKSAADVILNEVRKKVTDAGKIVELLKGLQKLRTLRKDRLEKQGVVTQLGLSQQFEKEIQEQLSIMEKQQEVYAAEEKALRVMLETEHEESKVKELEKTRQEHEEQIQRMLFGRHESEVIDETLFPFWQYYNQTDLSIESLVQIRREWDAFVVPESTPGGSRIPDGWVIPDKPSNDIWKTALYE